jgi:uncharacterized protein YneF (UPF0154 family)
MTAAGWITLLALVAVLSFAIGVVVGVMLVLRALKNTIDKNKTPQ